MSEDSKQLSVAELLARNGQQDSGSSGGGRRRRAGRGISVAELTGDLPVIGEGGGHSAHSAPDTGAAEESAYSPPSFEPPAAEVVSYEPPPTEPEPSYSPMSGPISMYDPLAAPVPPSAPTSRRSRRAAAEEPPAEEPPRRGRRASRHAAPADPLSPVTELYSSPPDPLGADAFAAEARTPAAEPAGFSDSYAGAPSSGSLPETPRPSGRRRRRA